MIINLLEQQAHSALCSFCVLSLLEQFLEKEKGDADH